MPQRSMSEMRSHAFRLMRQEGIVTATVSFSGGNDEGGPDSVVGTRADGTEVELPLYTYEPVRDAHGEVVYEESPDGLWRVVRQRTVPLGELSEALQAPVYSQYGGFAGDFSVTGTLTWDLAAGTCLMQGDESFTDYEPFSRELS